MSVELKVPVVGESISEVQIGEWYKSEGDSIEQDEKLVELETEKATFDVPAPARGVVSKILKRKGETAAVGEVIGILESAGAKGGGKEGKPQTGGTASGRQGDKERGRQGEQATAQAAETRVMPAAQRALADRGLRPEEVAATGPGGRLLKEDVQRHDVQGGPPAPAEKGAESRVPGTREDEVVPMSPLRRRIAQRLVEAQKTAALVTTFNEVDMTAVMELRRRHKDAFQEKYGVKLGVMSFFVKAAIDALKLVPQVNAEVRESSIVYHHYCDIGIAVGGGKGLVVPVLRNAERMSFAEIEVAIGDFAKRALENKLGIDELRGGTFTISNGGVYGSLLSTPIVNPPQSGVLGMHAIQDRPVARDGNVVIRPMMYIALTYDHRVVDGREAVTFLKRLKEAVEEPARMLVEV